jgi:hypothetical protein
MGLNEPADVPADASAAAPPSAMFASSRLFMFKTPL